MGWGQRGVSGNNLLLRLWMFCNSRGWKFCSTLALCGERWRNTSFVHAQLRGCADTQRPPSSPPLPGALHALRGVSHGETGLPDLHRLPQLDELMCLVGTFCILRCSASTHPPIWGNPQRGGQSSASQDGDLRGPGSLSSHLRVLGHRRVAAWLGFWAECHSDAGTVTGSPHGKCPQQMSCGLALATFPFCSVSLGPCSQPGSPACLLILGALHHFLIKYSPPK